MLGGVHYDATAVEVHVAPEKPVDLATTQPRRQGKKDGQETIRVRFRQFMPRLPQQSAGINARDISHGLPGEEFHACKRQRLWQPQRPQELDDLRREQTPRLPDVRCKRFLPISPLRHLPRRGHEGKTPRLQCFGGDDRERSLLDGLPRSPLLPARRPFANDVAGYPPQVSDVTAKLADSQP